MSLPTVPLKKLPPSSVSFPVPPTIRSLPPPPARVSLPVPPTRVSLPTLPFRVSVPAPPTNVSFPAFPDKLSSPAHPKRIPLSAVVRPMLSFPVEPALNELVLKNSASSAGLLGRVAMFWSSCWNSGTLALPSIVPA